MELFSIRIQRTFQLVSTCKANKLMYAVKNASSMNDFSHLNKFLSIQI